MILLGGGSAIFSICLTSFSYSSCPKAPVSRVSSALVTKLNIDRPDPLTIPAFSFQIDSTGKDKLAGYGPLHLFTQLRRCSLHYRRLVDETGMTLLTRCRQVRGGHGLLQRAEELKKRTKAHGVSAIQTWPSMNRPGFDLRRCYSLAFWQRRRGLRLHRVAWLR